MATVRAFSGPSKRPRATSGAPQPAHSSRTHATIGRVSACCRLPLYGRLPVQLMPLKLRDSTARPRQPAGFACCVHRHNAAEPPVLSWRPPPLWYVPPIASPHRLHASVHIACSHTCSHTGVTPTSCITLAPWAQKGALSPRHLCASARRA